MNTNDPGGSRTRDLRIKSRQHSPSDDNTLDAFRSDSGAVRAPDSASSGSESSTNPTTSAIPRVNPPIALLKDALQILIGVAGEADGEISDALEMVEVRGAEVRDLQRLITQAIDGLELERARRLEVLRQQLRRGERTTPALAEDLRLMERTNAERAAGPDAIIEEVVADSVAGSGR